MSIHSHTVFLPRIAAIAVLLAPFHATSPKMLLSAITAERAFICRSRLSGKSALPVEQRVQAIAGDP